MSNRTRGGARTGAGRPPKPASDRARRITITLPPELVAVAESIGGGNASKGVRVALRLAQAGDVVLVPKYAVRHTPAAGEQVAKEQG